MVGRSITLALIIALSVIRPIADPQPIEKVPILIPQPVISSPVISPPVEVSRGERVIKMECTAYTWTGDMTTSETWPARGTIAADPTILKPGTKVYIPGYGEGVVLDTGGDIKGLRLDLYMDSRGECRQWGRQMVEVEVE